jgi:hypothetical protein
MKFVHSGGYLTFPIRALGVRVGLGFGSLTKGTTCCAVEWEVFTLRTPLIPFASAGWREVRLRRKIEKICFTWFSSPSQSNLLLHAGK